MASWTLDMADALLQAAATSLAFIAANDVSHVIARPIYRGSTLGPKPVRAPSFGTLPHARLQVLRPSLEAQMPYSKLDEAQECRESCQTLPSLSTPRKEQPSCVQTRSCLRSHIYRGTQP